MQKFLGWLILLGLATFISYSIERHLESSPSTALLTQFIDFVTSKYSYQAVWATLSRFLAGFMIAMIVGSGLGLLIGRNKKLQEVSDPVINVLRPVPSIVVIPVSMFFMEYGSFSQLMFIVFYGAFWPVLLQVVQGVKDIDEAKLDLAKTLRKTRSEVFFGVILPASLPAIFVGARIAVGVSLLLVVTAEILVGANLGLGALLLDAQRQFEWGSMLAAATYIGILGYMLNRLFSIIEPIFLPWHHGRVEQID